MVLGVVAARRRLEEQACTVSGALSLIDDLITTASDEDQESSERTVNPPITPSWVTVPELGKILEAAVRRPDPGAEREQADNQAALDRLRPLLPVPGTSYLVPELMDRFQALCESLVLNGRLGKMKEAEELAQLGSSLVLHDDLTAAPMWDLDMGGDLCFAIAVATGDDQWYLQALDRYLASNDAQRAFGITADKRCEHALILVGHCLELCGSGVAPRRRILDIARQALAKIDPSQEHHSEVVRARYAVARASADRSELSVLSAPWFRGRDALEAADLRIAETLSSLADHDDWRCVFGPFAAPIYAWCLDVPQADAFTAFGLIAADDALPTAGGSCHAARIGQVTLAEKGCDQVGARVRAWMQYAARSPNNSGGYLIDGEFRPVLRPVPAAGMNSLARFARRDTSEVPESVGFLFRLGQEQAGDASFGGQADQMVAFFEGLAESETSDICGAILLGAASAVLPTTHLGTYITLLATGSGHDAAVRLASRGTTVTARLLP